MPGGEADVGGVDAVSFGGEEEHGSAEGEKMEGGGAGAEKGEVGSSAGRDWSLPPELRCALSS